MMQANKKTQAIPKMHMNKKMQMNRKMQINEKMQADTLSSVSFQLGYVMIVLCHQTCQLPFLRRLLHQLHCIAASGRYTGRLYTQSMIDCLSCLLPPRRYPAASQGSSPKAETGLCKPRWVS